VQVLRSEALADKSDRGTDTGIHIPNRMAILKKGEIERQEIMPVYTAISLLHASNVTGTDPLRCGACTAYQLWEQQIESNM
jgi:hypothetical protein